jgi:hypothetical protein
LATATTLLVSEAYGGPLIPSPSNACASPSGPPAAQTQECQCADTWGGSQCTEPYVHCVGPGAHNLTCYNGGACGPLPSNHSLQACFCPVGWRCARSCQLFWWLGVWWLIRGAGLYSVHVCEGGAWLDSVLHCPTALCNCPWSESLHELCCYVAGGQNLFGSEARHGLPCGSLPWPCLCAVVQLVGCADPAELRIHAPPTAPRTRVGTPTGCLLPQALRCQHHAPPAQPLRSS